MVKKKLKNKVNQESFLLLILAVTGLCFLFGCNVDLLGLFGSPDMKDRYDERKNFIFLNEADRTLTLGDEYSFIVLADTHIEDGDARGLEKLKNVILAHNSDAANINNQIKFVVICGDITQYGAEKEMQQFIDIAKSYGVPCYPVIGNHDVYFGNWPSVWKKMIGSSIYKVDGGETAFFMLDSANAFFGKKQLDWLEQEVKKTTGRVFVFTHSNLFNNNLVQFQQLTDTNERARIISILRGKGDIMFMGHSHIRLSHTVDNVQYINIEDFYGTGVYCLVTVKKSSVEYQFLTMQ